MQTDDRQWLDDYFRRYQESIFVPEIRDSLVRLKELIATTRSNGRKLIIAGNGGSAAIASHCAVDFTKQARVRCTNFNEADLITCFANDYGYENWVQKALEFYADDGDAVILVSSSGKSPNMINAATFALNRGLATVTFTGFAEDNPLKQLGQLNFWVNSRAYNIVEMTHQIWLLAVCDLLIGDAEYSAK
jgi:D-sedoheptulose 7-phosphate isomerase